ncbi:ABC transporter permease [Desulfurobacterium atlanticum]|uniref:Peptide/nickel transport system permease protein n=1 Tax=Desulfurobacterium atlanticum TaxID=240169 RepID=A0A238YF07_9BACT|nr:ABC transporter permease [Desulfurobacterium atlanticum]SNR69378.1 peptide/nickel transport system permease protein [Desulfurobacterium atlanticum]
MNLKKIQLYLGISIVIFLFAIAIFGPFVAPYDPIAISNATFSPPSASHIFGTDALGRDIFSRVLYGARISLLVSLLAVFIGVAIGTFLGLVAGFFGGKIDKLIVLFMDAMYAFPGLLLAITFTAFLGQGIGNVALAIAIAFVPTYFRLVRNQVLSIKREPFVEAAEVFKVPLWKTVFVYVLLPVVPTLAGILALSIGDAILTEAGLSYLGLGVPPPTPDWGADLSTGQQYILQDYWWCFIFPGIAIFLAVLGFALIGDYLSEEKL